VSKIKNRRFTNVTIDIMCRSDESINCYKNFGVKIPSDYGNNNMKRWCGSLLSGHPVLWRNDDCAIVTHRFSRYI